MLGSTQQAAGLLLSTLLWASLAASNSNRGQAAVPEQGRGSSNSSCVVVVPDCPLAAVVDARLSATCPVHSNACNGPSDIFPQYEVLSPCCNAHDWCYECGYTKGLQGVDGRRHCDQLMKQNMEAVCKETYSDVTELNSCLATADTMYNAVMVYQEGIGGRGSLNKRAPCPGDAHKLAATSFCFNLNYDKAPGVAALKSPGNGGPWGAWGVLAKCPVGSWAAALATRVEPYQGLWGDDTGLNAVRMHCTSSGGAQTTAQPIESHAGIRGVWSVFKSCSAGQHIIAIAAQVEGRMGLGDDTAANAVKALCSDGVSVLDNGNSLGYGTWSGWAYCPEGSAVCGFRIKVEEEAAIDDTAMNDIQVECCSLSGWQN